MSTVKKILTLKRPDVVISKLACTDTVCTRRLKPVKIGPVPLKRVLGFAPKLEKSEAHKK